MSKLDWRNIFNSSHKLHGHISVGLAAATRAGYPYFAWNETIYTTKDERIVGTHDVLGNIKVNTDNFYVQRQSGYDGYTCKNCLHWEYADHVHEHKCS